MQWVGTRKSVKVGDPAPLITIPPVIRALRRLPSHVREPKNN